MKLTQQELLRLNEKKKRRKEGGGIQGGGEEGGLLGVFEAGSLSYCTHTHWHIHTPDPLLFLLFKPLERGRIWKARKGGSPN